MKYRAVITGGTGFIGGCLVRALIAEGWNVHILTSGSMNHARVSEFGGRVTWSGISDAELDAVLISATHFFNFSVVYDRADIRDDYLLEVNVELPLRILQRLEVIGGNITCILGDSFFTKFPISATQQTRYTHSKNELNRRLLSFTQSANADRLRIVMLQIEQVYGPGEAFTKVFPSITKLMLEQKTLIPVTHGRQLRDFIYVEDVVSAILCISVAKWQGIHRVECGTGIATAVGDVLHKLIKITGSSSILGFGDLSSNQDIDISTANMAWLSNHGWTPKIKLDDGLRRLVVDVMNRLSAPRL